MQYNVHQKSQNQGNQGIEQEEDKKVCVLC